MNREQLIEMVPKEHKRLIDGVTYFTEMGVIHLATLTEEHMPAKAKGARHARYLVSKICKQPDRVTVRAVVVDYCEAEGAAPNGDSNLSPLVSNCDMCERDDFLYVLIRNFKKDVLAVYAFGEGSEWFQRLPERPSWVA